MIKKYWKIAAAAAFLTAAGFCYGFLRGEPTENGMSVPDPDGALETAAAVRATGNDDGAGKSAAKAGETEVDVGAAKAGAAEADGGAGVSQAASGETVGNSGGTAGASGETAPTPVASCFVHICGEVAEPGVYELPAGSRIFQAVEAAGGMTEQAAADSVNLAAPVQDGMRVKIPSLEEVKTLSEEELRELSAGGSIAGDSGNISGVLPGESSVGREPENGTKLVNLNTAGPEELMSLNGIGKARAEEIIRYRTEHGRFQSIEDIKDIPGIKDALFQKIKDSITV